MLSAVAVETGGSAVWVDEEALVREHLRLVHYAVAEVAARVPRHVNPDDLVSAGMMGLAQAARGYDPARGVTFPSFAAGRIKGALLDELRDRDWASRSVRAKARQVAETAEMLNGALRRTANNIEVAAALGVSKEEVEAVQSDVFRGSLLSLEALAAGDGVDVASSGPSEVDGAILDKERRAYLVAAVSRLPERLRRVVLGYFVEERSMLDLAHELGVTESRISQMRSEALALLRDGINSQLDPELVGEDPSPRVARRKAAYFAAIAARRREMRSFMAFGNDGLSALQAIPA
jgi:RNA polymerase sigma factor for flagellar operon FliA